MKKLLRNRGLVERGGGSPRKGGFQIVSPVFLKKSMFSLLLEFLSGKLFTLAVINRSILSCGLLFTRK